MNLIAVHALKPLTTIDEAVEWLRALEEDCKLYTRESRRMSAEMIHKRFDQGRIVSEVMALNHQEKYGMGLVAYLASQIDLHEQTLRDAHAVFQRAGSKAVFIQQWAAWEEEGRSITWSMVRNWGRKGLPESRDKAEVQIEKEKTLLERAAERLERRCTDLLEKAKDYPAEEIDAILGVVQRAQEAVTEVRGDIPEIMLPKPTRERDDAYLDHVRSMPCCVCGFGSTIAHHMDRGGLSTKGKDYFVLSLCTECHVRLHASSEREFWQSVAVDPWRVVSGNLAHWIKR